MEGNQMFTIFAPKRHKAGKPPAHPPERRPDSSGAPQGAGG